MTPESRLLASHDVGTLYKMMHDIAGKVDSLIDSQDSHAETREMILNHIKGEEAILEEYRSAFPGGDPRGHRAYHEELISREKARKEFWQKMTFELAKWGLIAFAGWMVVQLWTGALKGPK